MTPDEEFEKNWATQPYNQLCKPIAKAFYLAATKRTVERCVEICLTERFGHAECREWCAQAIKKEFGL